MQITNGTHIHIIFDRVKTLLWFLVGSGLHFHQIYLVPFSFTIHLSDNFSDNLYVFAFFHQSYYDICFLHTLFL